MLNSSEHDSVDPDKLLSQRRFRRGFKNGLRMALQAQALAIPIVSGVAFFIAPSEIQEKVVQTASNLTGEQLGIAASAMIAGEIGLLVGNASAAGLIDSFRPTSNRFKKYSELDLFRPLSSGIQNLRKP